MLASCRQFEMLPELPNPIQPDNVRTGIPPLPFAAKTCRSQVAQTAPELRGLVRAIRGDGP